MSGTRYSPEDMREIRKIKRVNLAVFGIFAALLALALWWFASFRYWRTFSRDKWLDHPDRRAKMTADLMESYSLPGMTEDEVASLLGPNDNWRGYFSQDHRFVYWLGNERTVIDSEWLLIDFENGVVKDISLTMD